MHTGSVPPLPPARRASVLIARPRVAPIDLVETLLFGICLSIFLLLSSNAQATQIMDFSFSDASTQSLDFNEISMTRGTTITDQYQAGYGVSFSTNVWFEDHRSGLTGWDTHNIANFLSGTSTSNPTVEIIFDGSVNAAAIAFTGNRDTSFLFEAVSAGSVIESFVFNEAECCAPQVLGFANSDFDAFRITAQSANTFFIADDLRWNSNAIPEPSTLLLTMLGLALLPKRKR